MSYYRSDMKKKNEHINDSLLLSYIKGEASPEETDELLQWIEKDPEHNERLMKIRKIWNLSSSLSEFNKIDVSSDWQKVQDKIWNRGKIDVRIPLYRKMIYRYGRIAASIVIIMTVGFYILYRTGLINTFQPMLTLQTTTEKSTVDLYDGTRVFLNENSTMVYPPKFFGKTRNIKISGEAFFEVARNEKKPFYISADEAMVKVLGTSFNVQAHSSENLVVVSVLEGKVALYPKDKEELLIELNRNEEGVLKFDSLSKSEFRDLNFLSWKTRKLVFDNTPVEEVILALEKHYKKSICLENVSGKEPMVTSVFNDQPFDEVLDELKILLDFSYQIRNDTVIMRLE